MILGLAEATSKQLEHEDPYTPPGTELSSTTAGSEAGFYSVVFGFNGGKHRKQGADFGIVLERNHVQQGKCIMKISRYICSIISPVGTFHRMHHNNECKMCSLI